MKIKIWWGNRIAVSPGPTCRGVARYASTLPGTPFPAETCARRNACALRASRFRNAFSAVCRYAAIVKAFLKYSLPQKRALREVDAAVCASQTASAQPSAGKGVGADRLPQCLAGGSCAPGKTACGFPPSINPHFSFLPAQNTFKKSALI